LEGAIKLAKKISEEKNYLYTDQFNNDSNLKAHKKTAEEILNQIENKLDAFVAGIGTGGTLIGIGKILKKEFPDIKIFGVWAKEPFGKHKIEGISDGFVPKFIRENEELIDGYIYVDSDSAIREAKKLSKRGYFVGISSGANFFAAKMLKKKFKNVLTVFPDNAYRYFSVFYENLK